MAFDLDCAVAAGCPLAEAAPVPVFGIFYESAFYRITVDVAEFFDELGAAPDGVVVVTGLPELA